MAVTADPRRSASSAICMTVRARLRAADLDGATAGAPSRAGTAQDGSRARFRESDGRFSWSEPRVRSARNRRGSPRRDAGRGSVAGSAVEWRRSRREPGFERRERARPASRDNPPSRAAGERFAHRRRTSSIICASPRRLSSSSFPQCKRVRKETETPHESASSVLVPSLLHHRRPASSRCSLPWPPGPPPRRPRVSSRGPCTSRSPRRGSTPRRRRA